MPRKANTKKELIPDSDEKNIDELDDIESSDSDEENKINNIVESDDKKKEKKKTDKVDKVDKSKSEKSKKSDKIDKIDKIDKVTKDDKVKYKLDKDCDLDVSDDDLGIIDMNPDDINDQIDPNKLNKNDDSFQKPNRITLSPEKRSKLDEANCTILEHIQYLIDVGKEQPNPVLKAYMIKTMIALTGHPRKFNHQNRNHHNHLNYTNHPNHPNHQNLNNRENRDNRDNRDNRENRDDYNDRNNHNHNHNYNSNSRTFGGKNLSGNERDRNTRGRNRTLY
jgi:hypothetical protein